MVLRDFNGMGIAIPNLSSSEFNDTDSLQKSKTLNMLGLPLVCGQIVRVEGVLKGLWFGRIEHSDVKGRHDVPVQHGWFPPRCVKRLGSKQILSDILDSIMKRHRHTLGNYISEHDKKVRHAVTQLFFGYHFDSMLVDFGILMFF